MLAQSLWTTRSFRNVLNSSQKNQRNEKESTIPIEFNHFLQNRSHKAAPGQDSNVASARHLSRKTISRNTAEISRQKFLLVLDYWERMVNIQNSLKRLVHMGVEEGFSVVEPFLYESKASWRLSFPEQFQEAGLVPQPASLFMNTRELHSSQKFVTYSEFANRAIYVPTNPQKMASHDGRIYLDALLYFDWRTEKVPKSDNVTFYWCNDVLRRYGFQNNYSTGKLWSITSRVVAGGAICTSPWNTIHPRKFNSTYFSMLFEAAATNSGGRVNKDPRSQVSVAILNYRKHVFSGYLSRSGFRRFQQKILPMQVGKYPRAIAEDFRRKHMKDKPVLAIHMRTGKTWTLFKRNHLQYMLWLSTCTDRIIQTAKSYEKQRHRDIGVYFASDMYNDGWKGGEVCPPRVCDALQAAKLRIELELNAKHFDPTKYNISQDQMGISSAVDAAMCFHADGFIYAEPSNFGRWIDEQRVPRNRSHAILVECKDILA